MTAAGFDHSLTILPCVESGPEPDMERHGNWKRRRGLLGQSSIHHCHKCQRVRGQDLCIWIDEHGDFICFQRWQQLIPSYEPGSHSFNRVLSFVDCFCKRDRPADSQWPFKFGDHNFDSCPMQAERDACREITAAS